MHEHWRTLDDLCLHDGEELSAILNHFLAEFEAVLAHFKRYEDAAGDLQAVLVDEVGVLLDHDEDFTEAKN